MRAKRPRSPERGRLGRIFNAAPARAAIALLSALLLTARTVVANPEPSPPSTAPAAHPLLDELNRETQSLYDGLQQGMVRVQLPATRRASEFAARETPFDKYKLDPAVRRQLLQQAHDHAESSHPNGEPSVAIGPSDSPATQPVRNVEEPVITDAIGAAANPGVLIVVPPPNFQPNPPDDPSDGSHASSPVVFMPSNIGLVLDEQGHVLVPQFVDRDAVGERPVRLAAAGGKVVEAKFIGSDQQTNLTLLQLPDPTGKPVTLSKDKPREGSLVLYLSPTDGSGRLAVWNEGGRESGVVVGIDGQVFGISRYGRFYSAAACELVAEQIIRHGAVRRATLGVIITQIEKDDPARAANPALGDHSAVRVDQVMRASAAEKGGLRQGDFILTLEGEPVGDIPTLAAAIAARDGETRLEVLRADRSVELKINLERK